MVQTIMTHIVRWLLERVGKYDEDNDGKFPGESPAEVRYGSLEARRASRSRHLAAAAWFRVGAVRQEEELSIGRQQAEGIEAPAERGYRPEVTLICREDLIGVVTIG